MKAMLVYGCPCSGKSSYVRCHAGDQDLIYDYDALIAAATTRTAHLTERHAAHFSVLSIRKAMADAVKEEKNVSCFWLQCRWPTDTVHAILDGFDTEEVFIKATREECYAHLESDDSRTDKDAWKAVIDSWFREHGENMGEEVNANVKRFWSWIHNEDGRTLRLEGPVDSESLWGDEITPKAFRDELEAEEGDVTVWINSPGGNVFAAAEIYTMLKDHKGRVTVKVDAIAASAASVIAMAGDRVLMSPVAMLMIHDPMTIAMGNAQDMQKAIATLNEVKESIINAYAAKSGMPRDEIADLMEQETWMNARKAVELGFADEVLYSEEEQDGEEIKAEAGLYSTKLCGQNIMCRLVPAAEGDAVADEKCEDDPGEPQDVCPPEEGIIPEEADTEEKKPVIGLDGKTEDGAMPFRLLMNQLDFLK